MALFGHDLNSQSLTDAFAQPLEVSYSPTDLTVHPGAAERMMKTTPGLPAMHSQPMSSPEKADVDDEDVEPNEDEILCEKCGNIAPCCYIGVECCEECWSDEEGK